ncbi:hypothetical protein [Burkholderia plantarii]|uniref:hypothetical protein n=1 Tax=Burkholderia plantarii TaxID=41899 RepID=UPI000870718E|nr:hypothetical protein [Burkholderia plantarii]
MKFNFAVGALACAAAIFTAPAHAQASDFKPGEVLTAQHLNEGFAAVERQIDEQASEIFWLEIAAAALGGALVVVLLRR